MSDDQVATMIANLPDRTGRSLDEWFDVLAASGLDRHGQLLTHLKTGHGVTHGFANLIVQRYRARDAGQSTDDDLVAAQYVGKKAHLRPICDRVLTLVKGFGADVEVAPKKHSVSLRRSKQFGLIAPVTNTRIDLGLNLRGDPGTERLRASSGMCTHTVRLTTVDDVDDELAGWLRRAYDHA